MNGSAMDSTTTIHASGDEPADALVIFGATGDLAHKKLHPALYRLAARGQLRVPVVGVARRGWSDDDFRTFARDAATAKVGDPIASALDAFSKGLSYVSGDYADEATFARLRDRLGDARRPAFYLAIPPSMFERVISELKSAGLHEGARIIVEKPFGRDLGSARDAEPVPAPGVRRACRLPHRPLPGQGDDTEPARLPLRQCTAGADLGPSLRLQRADHDGRVLRRRGPRRVLRGGRGDPGCGAEPPAAGGGDAGHGASRGRRCRRPPRREGQGVSRHQVRRPRHRGAGPVRWLSG